MSSQNSDPGNFANRPKEEAKNIVSRNHRGTDRNFALARENAAKAGRKGGKDSRGNFAHRIEQVREAGRNLEQETD